MVLKLFLWAHPVSEASTSLVSKKIEQEAKEYSMYSHILRNSMTKIFTIV